MTMAKKTTDIASDMPLDAYLTVVVGPTLTQIQDDLHQLKEDVDSLKGHHPSGWSSSETDELAENIAGKIVSKTSAPQVTQAEQKKDDQKSANSLLNAAKEGVRKEITPMVQSFGSVKTRLETAISSLENLSNKFDEYVKTNQIVAVSRIKRYLHLVLPAVTALAAFLLSWGAYHNSYHYWGERFHKLTNDPMQTEQPLLDLKYNSIEMIKIEFEGGRKQKAKETIKKAESRLRKHKRAVKKTERKRKRQARKAGGADHAE